MKILSYRKNEKDEFEILCRDSFKYLETDFKCKLISVVHDAHGTYLVYKNLASAVKISFAPYDGYIYVDVVRLLNGNIPQYPIFIKSDSILYEYSLFDVIMRKDPSFKIKIPSFNEWNKYDIIKRDIRLRAEWLKTYASDILRGDFSIFPELEKIVKARAEEIRKQEEKEDRGLKKVLKEKKKSKE